jgi:hypothetical protein
VVASERDEALSVKRSEGAPLSWTPQPFPREANLRGDLIGKDFVAAGPGLGINEGASNWNRVGQSPTAFQDFNKGQDGKHGSGGVSDLESTSPWVPPLRNEVMPQFPATFKGFDESVLETIENGSLLIGKKGGALSEVQMK